jgi:hypothetical protein
LVDVLGGEERIKNINNILKTLVERFNKESIKMKSFIFSDTHETSNFLETFKQEILNDFM